MECQSDIFIWDFSEVSWFGGKHHQNLQHSAFVFCPQCMIKHGYSELGYSDIVNWLPLPQTNSPAKPFQYISITDTCHKNKF